MTHLAYIKLEMALHQHNDYGFDIKMDDAAIRQRGLGCALTEKQNRDSGGYLDSALRQTYKMVALNELIALRRLIKK